MTTYRYRTDSELPVVRVHWQDATGAYYDFSSGWTFTAKVVSLDDYTTTLLTKTTGITGAAGTIDTPNITIAWAAGEMATIGAGHRDVLLIARRTADSFDLALPPRTIVLDVSTAPT